MSKISRGRCLACNIVWWWPRGRFTLKDTRCQKCGGRLLKTSQNVKAPERHYKPQANRRGK